MACNRGIEACGWIINPKKPSCICKSTLQCLNNALNGLMGVNTEIISILGTRNNNNVKEYLVLTNVETVTMPPTERLVVYVIAKNDDMCTVVNSVTICPLQ